MLSERQRLDAARSLRDAERDRAPIEPLTATYPDIDVVDAYEIALINIRARLEAGRRCTATRSGCLPRSCRR